jgi:hypothetical protein
MNVFGYKSMQTPRLYVADGATGNAVGLANVLPPFFAQKNLDDLPYWKFRLRAPGSTFCNHIRCIISRCSQKQMGDVDAAWHIASMANLHSLLDRTIGHFPRKAMGILSAAIPLKGAIAFGSFRMLPDMAVAIGLRGEGQSFGQCEPAWWYIPLSHLRSCVAFLVRAGYGVCALFRPANYSTTYG